MERTPASKTVHMHPAPRQALGIPAHSLRRKIPEDHTEIAIFGQYIFSTNDDPHGLHIVGFRAKAFNLSRILVFYVS